MKVRLNFNLGSNRKNNKKKLDNFNSKEEIKEDKVENVISFSEISKKRVRNGAANIINSKNKVKFEVPEKSVTGNKKISKSYYVLLFFMILLAGVSLKLVRDTYVDSNTEDYAVFSNEENYANDVDEEAKTTDQSSINVDTENSGTVQSNDTSNVDTRKDISITDNNSSVAQKIKETVTVKKEEPLVFIKPISGSISKIFSDDKVIYSKTLEMWKTHDGIDIKADIGTPVYSIEKGTVEKIYEDAFYGVTIVINHGQGYKSSYSNLDTLTNVTEGKTIKKGVKIGCIGNTSIGEIKDDSHLHFMLYENGRISDPTSIFN